jgi:O-antigen/teichoic acid export membrane protein
MPTSQIGFALSGLLLPAFAKVETKSGLRQSLVRVITVLTAVMIPGACFVSAFAELIIRITIGDKWVPAVPVAQLLVWAGIAASMSEIVSQILIRQGFPKYVLFVNASRAVILLGGFYPVLKIWGNCGMAGLLLFIAGGGLIAQVLMTHYQLHFRRRELLHSQRIAAAISAPVIMAYVGMMVLDLTYAVQAALAAITLASCGYVVFALRYSLANIIVPRSR